MRSRACPKAFSLASLFDSPFGVTIPFGRVNTGRNSKTLAEPAVVTDGIYLRWPTPRISSFWTPPGQVYLQQASGCGRSRHGGGY
jgi:hypothetical protein